MRIKKEELVKVGLSEENATRMLGYYDLSLDELKKTFANTDNSMLEQGLSELSNLRNILEEIGCGKDCVFAPSLARGQDYYTGNVFEVYAKNGELTCSLGGGGRYDKMITGFIDDGNIYPAVGVSFGLSTIYEILKMRNEKIGNRIDIYVIPMNTDVKALKLANDLRKFGYKVELEMTGRKLKKCFEYANKKEIPYVIVLGEDELKKREFKIKKMETGEEVTVSMKELEEVPSLLN